MACACAGIPLRARLAWREKVRLASLGVGLGGREEVRVVEAGEAPGWSRHPTPTPTPTSTPTPSPSAQRVLDDAGERDDHLADGFVRQEVVVIVHDDV
eukprot:scaffold30245_cov33-Phaeocystis_antarctica.AAC.2